VLLAIDVGNTETTLALFDQEEVHGHWRVTTDVPRTPDEWSLLLKALVIGGRQEQVHRVGLCSVVPPLTRTLSEAIASAFGVEPIVIDAKSPLPIRLAVDDPPTVGADRIVNTLAASVLRKLDCIVVDLGTATTYDCITADGVFLGGVIQPGVQTSAETLIRRTSQLPATDIVAPQRVIGTRTDECIRAGIVFGAAESIDGIVRRIKRSWPNPSTPLVLATGGLAETIRPFCQELDEVDPLLTLRGVRVAVELLSK
jgi:type III pantothenate kinase